MPKKHKHLSQIHYPKSIKGKSLDNYLAEGWYRMGEGIFTSHFLFYQGQLFSAIWLRVVLAAYTLSKSLRKIKRKNALLFTHTSEPYSYSEELEALYQLYKKNFKGHIPDSLSLYMMSSLDSGFYETWLVKVYEGDKLVACSIFDLGRDTIASIFGFYNPDYSTCSLGLYTMILEINFCLERKLTYYYTGYFVPGNPRFDYKLRIGHLEFWDIRTKEWLSYNHYDQEEIPLKVISRKLLKLKQALQEKYVVRLYQNTYIDAHIIEYFRMPYIDDPFFLCFEGAEGPQEKVLIVTFDLLANAYQLQLCSTFDPAFSNYDPAWIKAQGKQAFPHQLLRNKTFKKCKTVLPILRWLESEATSKK